MKWTVAWLPAAEEELAQLWMLSPSQQRDEISSIVNEIERQLRVHPHRMGDVQPRGHREVLVLPVGLAFQIFEADCLVRIIAFHVQYK